MTPCVQEETAMGLTPGMWAAIVSDMHRELTWIRSQRHLRPDEHYKQLQDLWNGASRAQRAALTELLMMAFCHMHLVQDRQPTEEVKS